jgi:hypothetical protein
MRLQIDRLRVCSAAEVPDYFGRLALDGGYQIGDM